MKKKKTIKRKKVVKKAAKKTIKKAVKKKPVKKREVQVGTITHYFPHVKAAVFKVKRPGFAVGDAIRIQGHTTDFKQKVGSIEIDRVSIQKARPGQEIGIKVKSRVRINDKVHLLS